MIYSNKYFAWRVRFVPGWHLRDVDGPIQTGESRQPRAMLGPYTALVTLDRALTDKLMNLM
jgi:hypothetical protein